MTNRLWKDLRIPETRWQNRAFLGLIDCDTIKMCNFDALIDVFGYVPEQIRLREYFHFYPILRAITHGIKLSRNFKTQYLRLDNFPTWKLQTILQRTVWTNISRFCGMEASWCQTQPHDSQVYHKTIFSELTRRKLYSFGTILLDMFVGPFWAI